MNEVSVIISRLTESFLLNCKLFALTLIFSLPLGVVISFGSMSRFRPLRWLVRTIVWMVRGPLDAPAYDNLLWARPIKAVLSWPGGATGRFVAATVAFVINYACYYSEIFRGGIESIPKGQYEAGQVLGMTKVQIFQGYPAPSDKAYPAPSR